jgi:hypothetical protein
MTGSDGVMRAEGAASWGSEWGNEEASERVGDRKDLGVWSADGLRTVERRARVVTQTNLR